MQAIVHDWLGVTSQSIFRIIPLGDIHLGNTKCDEAKLERVVAEIAGDPFAFWIDMGDRGEWINRRDPRFDPDAVASWVSVQDLKDIGQRQLDRYEEIMSPIAHKCLAMVKGNHEETIEHFTERDVHSAAVNIIKRAGNIPRNRRLSVDFTGWIMLRFYESKENEKRHSVRRVTINVHHGYADGKLDGAKALALEKRVWTHNADICLMGHSHNAMATKKIIEKVDRRGNIVYESRYGSYTCSFLGGEMGQVRYAKKRGYFPNPTGNIEVVLRPAVKPPREKIKIIV
jgi:predicted phosphodiesterase